MIMVTLGGDGDVGAGRGIIVSAVIIINMIEADDRDD